MILQMATSSSSRWWHFLFFKEADEKVEEVVGNIILSSQYDLISTLDIPDNQGSDIH